MTDEEPKKELAEGEEVEAEEVVQEPEEPPPDPLLKELYDSTRPSVQLIKGIGLAPIVCAVWPAADAQVRLLFARRLSCSRHLECHV